MDGNQEILQTVQKVLSTDFTTPGGLLSPKQQARFFEYLRVPENAMLSRARMHVMTQKQEDIDKMFLGGPITKGWTENGTVGYDQAPVFGGTVRLNTTKTVSSWMLTAETLRDNIEKDKLQAHLASMMFQKIADDLELLGCQGDDSIAGSTDPLDLLLKLNDGWDVLSDDAPYVDAGGAEISKDHFNSAWKQMPDHFKSMRDMAWFANPTLVADYREKLQDRQTAVGDDALRGAKLAPIGIPVVEVFHLPRHKTVSIAAATPGVYKATVQGPYYISATKKMLALNVNAVGAIQIDLSTGLKNGVTKGPLTAWQVAKVINDALVADGGYGATYAKVASDDGFGRLVLTGKGTGTASIIDVDDATGTNDANSLFGWAANPSAQAGAAAGSGTQPNGTFVWLSSPRNFIYAVLGKTRVSSFYQQTSDRLEVVCFNEVDYQIEETDALVKVRNLYLD